MYAVMPKKKARTTQHTIVPVIRARTYNDVHN